MDGDFEVALLAEKRVYVEAKAGRGDLSTIGDDIKFTGASLAPSKPKNLDRKKLIGR